MPPTVEEIYELGCDLDEADPERAESSYRQVIAQAPQHADAHINLGRILHERGDLPAAEEHYRRALAIRPHDPTASFNLGVVLEDGGHHADALEAYQRAIAADERNADAHYNAARLYDLLGDYARGPAPPAHLPRPRPPPAIAAPAATTTRRGTPCPGHGSSVTLFQPPVSAPRAFVPIDPGRRRRSRRA